jgi:hypothetical protein
LLTESGDDVVRVCTLDRIVDTWRRAISQPDVALRTWLEHFEQRYVRLDDSEPAWQSHRATVGRRAT